MNLSPTSLGFPQISGEGCISLGHLPAMDAIGWMPGIRTDYNLNYLVRCDGWDVKRYFEAGGDPKKCIVHFLCEDNLIEPLWKGHLFLKKVAWLQERGISKVVSPDFSAWKFQPLIYQLYQVYRSAVVSSDFIKAGFSLIPNVGILALDGWLEIWSGWWPDSFPGPILIDAHHQKGIEWGRTQFWKGARWLVSRWPKTPIWLWARTDKVAKEWATKVGPCTWVPTRSYMQDQVVKARKQRQGRLAPTA